MVTNNRFIENKITNTGSTNGRNYNLQEYDKKPNLQHSIPEQYKKDIETIKKTNQNQKKRISNIIPIASFVIMIGAYIYIKNKKLYKN